MANTNVREFVISSLKKYHEKLNKQLSDSSYISIESDPTVPGYVKNITSTDISNWNAAEANIQSDWNITNSSSAAYIKNKPNIPSIDGLATETYVDEKVASIVNSAPETLDTLNELADALGNDPNFATTVATQIGERVSKTELAGLGYVTQTTLSTQGYLTSQTKANWNETNSSSAAYIQNKPTIPDAANDSTITIQKGGTNVDTFTTNAASNKTINIPNELPTYSSSDAGKVLSINSSGQLVWVTPVNIYTGTGEPSNSVGNDGDIYLQTS